MAAAQRITFVVLVAAAMVAGIVDAVLYLVAVTNLATVTSVAGFDTLTVANRVTIVVAGLAALAVIVRTLGTKRLAVPAFSLLLMSGLSALIAGGLYGIGTTLFRASNQAIRSDMATAVPGSPALHLNSLISGVMGSGYYLAPVPVVFAIAAALVPLFALARRASVRAAVRPAEATI